LQASAGNEPTVPRTFSFPPSPASYTPGAMNERNVAFLGGGRMGEALISGLIRSKGRMVSEIMVTSRREERALELGQSLGVAAGISNPDAVAWASTLVLTVKPQDMEALLQQISDVVTEEHLVISFAAGIRTSFIEKYVPRGTPVVRVMSNVAVLVDEAMSVISPGGFAKDEHLTVAAELLKSVGRVIRLPEKHQDAVTATSGSGPAYFFLLAEAMIEACILLGLSRDVATELIIQTMVGSAKMLRDTKKHPVELREMVTSPGGTTIMAIKHLEQAGVRAAFLNAIDAACKRSAELAIGHEPDEEER
jgi:pyrroline-5-carboxylate reductase